MNKVFRMTFLAELSLAWRLRSRIRCPRKQKAVALFEQPLPMSALSPTFGKGAVKRTGSLGTEKYQVTDR